MGAVHSIREEDAKVSPQLSRNEMFPRHVPGFPAAAREAARPCPAPPSPARPGRARTGRRSPRAAARTEQPPLHVPGPRGTRPTSPGWKGEVCSKNVGGESPKCPKGCPCSPSCQCHHSCRSKQSPGHQILTANLCKSELDFQARLTQVQVKSHNCSCSNKKFLTTTNGGEMLEQVAHRAGSCPDPGKIQGQTG